MLAKTVQEISNLRSERQISTTREMMPIHMVKGTAACTNCSKPAAVKAATWYNITL